jgi:hypothetical protein
VGIVQFIVLSLIVLIYVAISGALALRLFGLALPERFRQGN